MWNSHSSILIDGSGSPLHDPSDRGILLGSTSSIVPTLPPLNPHSSSASASASIFASPTSADQSHLRFSHDPMHLSTPNVSTSHTFHTPQSQSRVQRSFAPLNLMDESEENNTTAAGIHHDTNVTMTDVTASPAHVNLSGTVVSRVSSSRLRAKHERTLAAMNSEDNSHGNGNGNDEQTKEKLLDSVRKSSTLSLPSAGIDSHDLPLSLLSPPATPARSSSAAVGGGGGANNADAPFLSSPTSHLELHNTQLGGNATPTRATRASSNHARSTSISLESPLQQANAASNSSPTSRSESSQSSNSASGSPSHPIASSFHSPDRALDLHFNASAYSPALRTPSAAIPRGDARYSLRHAAGMKTAFALNSPSVFSPAPSGMRGGGGVGSVRVIDDSPASTHSARLKLQQALNLDEPAPNASLLFSTSQSSSANNSPLLLGITASPSTLANLNLDAQHRSIGNISNHATGGDRMMPDEPAAPAVDADVDQQTEASPKLQRKKKRAAEMSEQQLKEDAQEDEKKPAPTTSKERVKKSASTTASDAAPASGTTDPNAATTNKPCNCKKSKCLKLYCECFARQDFCRGCNCVGCFNTPDPENKPSRDKAILGTIERDPQAFFRAQLMAAHQNEQKQEKHTKGVKEEAEVTSHAHVTKGLLGSLTASQAAAAAAAAASSKAYRKGCHCKKSECLKKYCECYQAGVACDSSCKCTDCKNCYGSSGNNAGDDANDGAAPAVEDADKKMKRSKSAIKPKVSTSTTAPSTQPQFTPEMLAQMGQMGIMPFLSNELMAFALQTNPAAVAAAAAAAAAMQQAQQAAAKEANEKQSTIDAKSAESSDAAVKSESEATPASPVKESSKTPNPHVLTTPPSASTAAHAISANTTPVPPVNNAGSQPLPASSTASPPPPRHSTRGSPASASSPVTRRSTRGRVDKTMTPDLTLDRMEVDDNAGASSAASPLGKENRHPDSSDSNSSSSTTPSVTKRSNRIITSTSKAAEFKAQTQNNTRTLTKAAKTRLSSTLDKLPPSSKTSPSSSSALNGNDSEGSEGADDTPHSALRHRSKRQRLPPVM